MAFLLLFHPGITYAALAGAADNSCIGCHRSLADARLSQPVALWTESVHAEVGNTCEGCHGGDPKDTTPESMSGENNFFAAPEEGEIVGFCRKCHQALADHFITSVHAETKSLSCIDCHGSHTIQRISAEIINEEKCTTCHDYESAEKMKTLLEDLHRQFHAIDSRLKAVKKYPTLQIQNDLDRVWKQLRKVRMISHTFDLAQIEEEAGKVKVALARNSSQIDRLNVREKSRNFWGFIAVFVFLGLAGLTYFYNKRAPTD